MELRSFSHLHFIQKVSAAGVKKVMNVSRGRPELVFRKVDDIYGVQEALPGSIPSRLCQGEDDQAQLFGSQKIKAEVPDPFLETDTNEDGDASERDADLDDFMTLDQIKKTWKLKKKKRSSPGGVHEKVVGSNDEGITSQPEQDDNDLTNTLSMWKLKVKKNHKGKKKRVKKYASSYQNAIVAVKSERIFFNYYIPEDEREMPMPLAIEFEGPDCYHSDYESALCTADSEPLVSHFLEYEPVSEQSDECVLDSESSPFLEPGISDADTPSAADTSVKSYQGCLQAEDLEEEEEECIISIAAREIPINDFSIDSASADSNYSTDNISLQLHRLRLSSSQHVEPLNDGSVVETSAKCSLVSERSPTGDANLHSSAAIGAESSPQGSPKIADEQVTADANLEKNCLDGQHTSPKPVENHSTLNLQHSLQRLFSARKVISPTSQEWLCKAMRSNEVSDEEYLYRCKGVYFKKQRESKFSRAIRTYQIRKCELPISPERNCINQKHDNQESPQRDELLDSPKENLSSQNHNRKGSPPKGIAKTPQVSNAAPRLIMSCNTTRSCSENAVSFSQRQLQDIENIAAKLMMELKSMKDIVEEGSCSGAYTTMNSRYDPDEVRMRIETATKAEETARKWLSIMSRDCNRFCKIMKMSENSREAPQSPSSDQKGKRKISFADEAGKKLCHVKYF